MTVPDIAYLALEALLAVTMLAASVRIGLGPTLADRVVAFDILTMAAFGTIVVHAVRTSQPALLDAALVLALLAFLATVALARFLERREPTQRRTV